MRVATIGGLALLAFAGHGFAAASVYFTPDEAVHRCLAVSGEKVEQEFGGSVIPVEAFETSEMDGGWRVEGTYRIVDAQGNERTVRVTCHVRAEGTEVTTELSSD